MLVQPFLVVPSDLHNGMYVRRCTNGVICMYVCRSTSFMGTNSSSVCGPTLATPTNVARDYTPPQLFLPVCTMLPHTYTYVRTYVHTLKALCDVCSHLVPHYLAGLLRMAGMYVRTVHV